MKLRELLSLEIVRYGLVSFVALLFDAGLLTLLVAVGMHYLVAGSLSFLAGGVVAYLLSVRFVFRHRRLNLRSVEATAFVALGAVGLVVNGFVIGLVVGRFGGTVLLGKAIACVGTFAANFLLRKLLLFTPREAGGADAT